MIEKGEKRALTQARLLKTVPGVAILLFTVNAKADDSEASSNGAGCETIEDGPSLTIKGSCITAAPWLSGTELELDGTIRGVIGDDTLHLVSGKVVAHNFDPQKRVKIAVDGSEHALTVDPEEVVEVLIKDTDLVACYSHSGETELTVSYLKDQIKLEPGQGRTVVLSDSNGNEVACGIAARWGTHYMGAHSGQLIVPNQHTGVWIVVLPSIVLAYLLRRKWRPTKT